MPGGRPAGAHREQPGLALDGGHRRRAAGADRRLLPALLRRLPRRRAHAARRRDAEPARQAAGPRRQLGATTSPTTWARCRSWSSACITAGAELPADNQAGLWGSLLPAAWSYQLAARARGLGTRVDHPAPGYEREIAELLGIPPQVRQGVLLPTAYYTGETFRPAPREPLETGAAPRPLVALGSAGRSSGGAGLRRTSLDRVAAHRHAP